MTRRNSESAASPYVIGAGLGLLEAFAFATAKRGLGVTTAFENVAAISERAIAPDVTRVNEYIKLAEKKPKLDWEAFLVAGIVAGSFLAAQTAKEERKAEYSPLWVDRFGTSPLRRNVAAFLGGAMVMVGARMAKGCTSGHGLTGNLQLALSSLLFTPVMGLSAVLASKAIYRKDAGNE